MVRYLLAIAGVFDLDFLADKDSSVAWWYSLDINAKLAADAVQAVACLHCVLSARRTMLCSSPGGKCDGGQRGVGVGQGGRDGITAWRHFCGFRADVEIVAQPKHLLQDKGIHNKEKEPAGKSAFIWTECESPKHFCIRR
jgi:hypothetical protein